MKQYSKYTWVCTGDCDALIEYTYKDGYGWPNGVMQLTCPCGSTCTLLSVAPATIVPSTTKEGQTMETTETTLATPYNADLLVTYKIIHGYSDPEYVTDKVRNIEWELSNARTNSKAVSSLQNKINSVKDIIIEAFADSDDQDTLKDIAETLDIELTKEISWEATLHVSGTMQVSLLEDYDFESELNDNLFVDSQHGDIVIGDYEVANVQESY
jgi:flagellar basal body-associated protein FliL